MKPNDPQCNVHPRLRNANVQPRPRRPHRFRWLVIAIVVMIALGVGVVVSLAVGNRVETGQWKVPEPNDLVEVVRKFERQVERGPSKTIYLERRGVELSPGVDDAPAGVSSVLASGANKPVRTKPWSGGDANWNKLVKCVQTIFGPFDLEVTDKRPTHDDFVMVAVGGRPGDIGVKDTKVSGLAPFNSAPIPRAVVFAFSVHTRNDVRVTCETISMEVGHAYGLDHEYLCKDVMTYLRNCGSKSFVDADAPCGEGKKRACANGDKTQNSFRHMLTVVGTNRASESSVASGGSGSATETRASH